MSKLITFLALCIILLLAAGQAQAFPGSAASGQADSTAPGPAASAPAAGTGITGTVVETMTSGGYTYALLELDGKAGWTAMPPTKLEVGEVIEIAPGMSMENFTSSSLDHTFERIYFTQGVVKR